MFFRECRGKQKKSRGPNTSPEPMEMPITACGNRPRYTSIIETGVSGKSKRLFLESLHSFFDRNSVNESAPFPRVYASLHASLGSNEQ